MKYTYVEGLHESYNFKAQAWERKGAGAHFWFQPDGQPVADDVVYDLIKELFTFYNASRTAREIDFGALLVGGFLKTKYTVTFEGIE